MPPRSDGFTLLELMIVIVLIGILLGMVSLAMGQNPARQARQEADSGRCWMAWSTACA